MNGRFRIRWPDFEIATLRAQPVTRYESGTACFDRCLALVGRSGVGKSLFGRTLAGLLPSGLSASGEPALERRSPSGDYVRIAYGDMAYVPQSPASALPSAITCGALLQEVIGWRRPDRSSRSSAAYHLERVGLDPATSELQASQLSGGMAQRFAISLAIAREPRLLLLDEPTVGLDADAARRVLEVLASLLEDGETAAIVMTHDCRASDVADERLMLERQGSAIALTSDEGVAPR